MRKLVISFLALLMIGSLMAQITFSGAARVRPRWDIKDYGDFPNGSVTKTTDMYIYYRASLNAVADIGDGWMAKVSISGEGPGNFGTMGEGSPVHSLAHGSGKKQPIYFNQLFFGYKTDVCGLLGGIVPINGINNPIIDLHYFPYRPVDIPWVLFNVNSATGFIGYGNIGPGTLGLTMTVNDNVTNTTEYEVDDDAEHDDEYTFAVNYTMPLAGLKVQPSLYKTMGSDGCAAPMTFGINVFSPPIAGFKFAGSFASTKQEEEVEMSNMEMETGQYEYEGTLFRVKASTSILGPGSMALWYDMATVDWDGNEIDHSYMWAHYKVVVHKSDFGEISIKPTLRLQWKESDYDDFFRTRFEITTEILFK